MRRLLGLSRAVDGLSRALGRAAGWLTLVMVLVGAFNAVARYVERDLGVRLASNAYIELQWYLFSLIFLFGAPYALRAGAHVRVDVLYGGHSDEGKAWIDLVGTLVFLIPFCLFAAWISWDFVVDSVAVRETSSDPGGLARWPLKAAVPVAFLLLAAQGASEAVKRAAFLRGYSAEEAGLVEPEEPEEAKAAGAAG